MNAVITVECQDIDISVKFNDIVHVFNSNCFTHRPKDGYTILYSDGRTKIISRNKEVYTETEYNRKYIGNLDDEKISTLLKMTSGKEIYELTKTVNLKELEIEYDVKYIYVVFNYYNKMKIGYPKFMINENNIIRISKSLIDCLPSKDQFEKFFKCVTEYYGMIPITFPLDIHFQITNTRKKYKLTNEIYSNYQYVMDDLYKTWIEVMDIIELLKGFSCKDLTKTLMMYYAFNDTSRIKRAI